MNNNKTTTAAQAQPAVANEQTPVSYKIETSSLEPIEIEEQQPKQLKKQSPANSTQTTTASKL